MTRIVVPANTNLADLAPVVRVRVELVFAGMAAAGLAAIQFDTLRSDDRQAFLFGKGRTEAEVTAVGLDPSWAWPDSPDGRVTKAAHGNTSWHRYGVACDIVENDKSPWSAAQTFWNTLGTLARANYLTWGGDWRMLDLPHTQARELPTSPRLADRELLASAGVAAVWAKYGLN